MIQIEEQFDYLKIKIAAPDQIRYWGTRVLPNGQYVGEVFRPETINYKTHKPEMDGLFCERIFGPIENFECACGKYKYVPDYEGLVCERCGVELTDYRVRRHRMGYLKLIYPVTHIWYLESRPNFLALLLEVEQCEKRIDTGLVKFQRNRDWLLISIYKEALRILSKTVTEQSIEKFRSDILSYCTELADKSEKACIKSLLSRYTDLRPIFFKKPRTSAYINALDQRIKRINLGSIIYFMSSNEIQFHCMHWDLQKYRRARELGFTMYCFKPYPNLDRYIAKRKLYRYYTRELPKFLSAATPLFLFGTRLIKKELERLNLPAEIIKTRNFITVSIKVLSKERAFYKMSRWYRAWERKRIHKLLYQSIRRLRIMENLVATGVSPSWMVITFLPVSYTHLTLPTKA